MPNFGILPLGPKKCNLLFPGCAFLLFMIPYKLPSSTKLGVYD